ncbi:hypothetical protein L6R29_05720 [Myxococcota bacterium]|nr:hypothetical protein [Myxococcota bacterium]
MNELKTPEPPPQTSTDTTTTTAISAIQAPTHAETAAVSPSVVASVPVSATTSASTLEMNKRISYVQQTLTYTQQWILLADTKGGLLLTVSGVIVGFMIGKFGEFSKVWSTSSVWYIGLLLLLFAGYAYWQVRSFVYTMWTILPRPMGLARDYLNKTRHVFNYSLTLNFPKIEDTALLKNEYAALTEQDLFEEYVTQLHIDSMVCSEKYKCFMEGFQSLKVALIFGGLAFLGSIPAIQLAGTKTVYKQALKQEHKERVLKQIIPYKPKATTQPKP